MLNEGQRRGQVVKNDLHLTGHGVVERRAGAPVGNMRDEGAGQVFEQLSLQVADTARAGRGVRVLARAFLELGKELFVIARRKAGVNRNDVGRCGNVDDRGEVGQRVVGHFGVDGRVGCRG